MSMSTNEYMFLLRTIATDKRGYPHNSFLYLDENMLWVLIRSTSLRRF